MTEDDLSKPPVGENKNSIQRLRAEITDLELKIIDAEKALTEEKEELEENRDALEAGRAKITEIKLEGTPFDPLIGSAEAGVRILKKRLEEKRNLLKELEN